MRKIKFFSLASLGAIAVLLGPARLSAQSSDAELADRASAAVRQYVHFGIFDDVEIAVVDREATLTGRVTMPFKRNDIGERVAKVDGLRKVVNQIEVLPASIGDSGLRVKVARAIYNNPTFWQYASMVNPPIHIIVERSRITLTGYVNNEVERMLAYALATQVDGSLGVTNKLKLDRR